MVKHGLNSFLALSVTFANELATLCEQVGADAAEVEKGLRSDPRIGPGAYMRPGPAFAGGTLARDVQFLRGLAKRAWPVASGHRRGDREQPASRRVGLPAACAAH